eukprot:188183-Rhodomonas_salina.1
MALDAGLLGQGRCGGSGWGRGCRSANGHRPHRGGRRGGGNWRRPRRGSQPHRRKRLRGGGQQWG